MMIDIKLKAYGSSGTGKTIMLDLIKQFCEEKGLYVNEISEHEIIINGEYKTEEKEKEKSEVEKMNIVFEKEMERGKE